MNSVVRNISIVREPSSGDFRSAMRQLTGGVSVITAGRGKDNSGMTVTSVSSLAVDPPALIVSVNRAASSLPLLKRYGFFGVNILTSDQLDIAERFTGKDGLRGAERFAGAEWTTGASGVPHGRRAGRDRLRGGRDRRAAFACHHHRPGARRHRFHAQCGAGLLARAICGDRSGRGCSQARLGQRPDPGCCALDPEGCVARAR